MAEPLHAVSTDLQIRIDDYLNDKLQTQADLDSLDSLLDDVKNRHNLLREQLKEAHAALEDARKASDDHRDLVRRKAEQLRQDEDNVEQRIQQLANSNESDEAIAKFEGSMERLHRLELAVKYVNALSEATALQEAAQRDLESNPARAVRSYSQLRLLSQALRNAQPAAEGAAPHLLNEIEQQVSRLYESFRKTLEARFEKTLAQLGWPRTEIQMSGQLLEQWTSDVNLLLELQEPDLEDFYTDPNRRSESLPLLLPLQVMTRPFMLRFRYHFYGKKPTNRLDKPEYFFSHVQDLLESHSPFINEMLQPILDQRNDLQNMDEDMYPDAISCFISALLPAVSEKSLSLIPQIATQPQLLSHFVHELISFDMTVRDSWAYTPSTNLLADWQGLTCSILATKNYFEIWLQAERQFALERYRVIRDAAESGELDLESTDSRTTKPTKGAVRVNDLLETVTDRYRHLTAFAYKIKFLVDIQLDIFDDYHARLHDALQAWIMTSHTAGRLVQGQNMADQGSFSLQGIESLCRVFGSADYLERKMSDWSDDVFFLELWEELNDRASQKQKRNNFDPQQQLNFDEIAAKTSANIMSKDDETREGEGGALFDETAAAYRRIRERTEEQLLRATDFNIRNSIKAFNATGGRATLSDAAADPSSLTQSSSLDSLTQTLSSLFGYLFGVLGPIPLRRMTRHTCNTISREVWDNALMKHSFSTTGYAQFRRDITAIQDCIDTAIRAPGEASKGMPQLDQALILLGLPIRASQQAESNDDDDDNGAWDFEDAAEDQDSDNDTPAALSDEDKIWGLWEVEKRLNKSNAAARTVLAEMGLTEINEKDARRIVARRVEVNS